MLSGERSPAYDGYGSWSGGKEKSLSNPDSQALLVMDVQEGIVARYVQEEDNFLKRLQTAISAAHAASIPVIYVRVGFRQGAPEISSRNKTFSRVKEQGQGSLLTSSMEIHPAIAPQPADIVVTKRRVSAFSGSDLEVVLRAQGITHLVLSGIATSGVVLSTLREAADKDYELTVLSDCCLDADDEVQQVLLYKVFPRQADVVTVEEWKVV
jgi:nicotinamidase-related amidase